jgi:hypothetical protein
MEMAGNEQGVFSVIEYLYRFNKCSTFYLSLEHDKTQYTSMPLLLYSVSNRFIVREASSLGVPTSPYQYHSTAQYLLRYAPTLSV